MRFINYYHESMGFLPKTYDEIFWDLRIIGEKFTGIKIYHNPYHPERINLTATIADIAKKKFNLKVIWIENNDSIQLTEANWADYVAKVKQDCLVAKRMNVDEFVVGNEISIHNDGSVGFNDANLPIKIKQLVNECRTLIEKPVSYQEGWWKKDAWHLAGLGDVSRLLFTLYENDADFEKHLRDIHNKFGKDAAIGEWSLEGTFEQSAADEIVWAGRLAKRLNMLDTLDIEHHYFCFRDTGVDNNNKGFGLWKFDKLEPHFAWFLW